MNGFAVLAPLGHVSSLELFPNGRQSLNSDAMKHVPLAAVNISDSTPRPPLISTILTVLSPSPKNLRQRTLESSALMDFLPSTDTEASFVMLPGDVASSKQDLDCTGGRVSSVAANTTRLSSNASVKAPPAKTPVTTYELMPPSAFYLRQDGTPILDYLCENSPKPIPVFVSRTASENFDKFPTKSNQRVEHRNPMETKCSEVVGLPRLPSMVKDLSQSKGEELIEIRKKLTAFSENKDKLR